jgi:hypothetical protein
MRQELSIRMLARELRDAHDNLVAVTQSLAKCKQPDSGDYDGEYVEMDLVALVRIAGALAFELEAVEAAVAVEEVDAA